MRALYCLYQLLISPVLLLLTLLAAVATIVGCTFFNASWWSYYPGRLWSRAFIRLLLLPVKVEGLAHMDKQQSYVIVPNHQGAFDIFLIYGFLNRHFKWMMKSELRAVPLVGKASESAGFIFVDQKGGPRSMQATHDQAREVLREGVSLVVFAEGARTWDGRMRAFKRGAFQLADELQLPILPVTINGSFEVLPRSRGFNFVSWHPLRLTVHAPVAPHGKGAESEREVMREVYDIVESALDEHYKVKNDKSEVKDV